MTEIFALLAELCIKRGITKINQFPGLTEVVVDEHWIIKINPHDETIESIPPFHASVEYNGWPAGIINPFDGILIAGECANENTLCKALKDAIGKETWN